MRISEELSEQILETCLQIESKFGISIGYSHPMGSFLDKKNDFVIYQQGDYNLDIEDFDYDGVYLIEYNKFEHETLGIISKLTTDLEQKSERISNLLIDFYMWLKNGEITVEEDRTYKDWKWKPSGDGRFHVEKKTAWGTSSYMSVLEDFHEEDEELKEYISKVYTA